MDIHSKLTYILAAAALTVGIAGGAMAADSIKIGVAGAHSGDLASYGLPTVKATELVVAELNAKGGINGRKVELMIEDDICKPEVATNTATKLVSGGVHAIIGHICSGATKAALPIYRNSNIIVISPSATDSDLTQSGEFPNFFRTIAPNDAQARTEVDFALDVLGLKTFAIIHDKGDYGRGFAEDVRKFLKQSGRAEVLLFEGVTPGAVDYSAIIKKVRRSKAEAVIFGGYHPEASKLVTQMRRKRMDTIFLSCDGVKDNSFIIIAGKHAEGVYATGPADVSGNQVARKFREKHREVYNSEPGAFFNNAVTAALAITNAIEKAGPTDSAAIAKAMHSEKVATPFGEISFDKNGDAIGIDFVVYQVRDGVFVQVK
jgi:branched-chain amino acid transport system substrate-binding protein